MLRRLLCFSGLLLCVSASAQMQGTDALVKLCDVWSTVKFHDPQLMLRQVDWDGALVRAIPKAREAQTTEQLAGVIGSMLGELSDPASRVYRQNTPRTASEKVPLFRWDGDALIVNIGPYTESVSDEALLFSVSAKVAAELAKAKSVVFDLRTRAAETPGWILDDLSVVRDDVPVPPSRYAFHSGYAPDAGSTSGGYYSALQVG